MNLRLCIRLCVLGSAALGLSASSRATPFKFISGATSLSSTADISIDGNQSKINAYVGQYSIQLGVTTLNTYCVDVANDISVGNTVDATLRAPFATNYADTITGATYLNGATYAARLKNANAVAYLIDTYLKASVTQAQAVNTGLAIWDIENDGGDGVSVGNFQASNINGGGSVAGANALIAAALGQSAQGGVTWIQNPKLGTGAGVPYQDFGIRAADYPIPEPAFYQMSVLLAGGGFVALRRRRRN